VSFLVTHISVNLLWIRLKIEAWSCETACPEVN
jgi:hypothetical protein